MSSGGRQQPRGRRVGALLGLAGLALTTQASAAGFGPLAVGGALTTGPDTARLALADTGSGASPSTSAESAAAVPAATRKALGVPALEVGATPLGARRPVTVDGIRATTVGTLPGPAAYAYTFAASALEQAEPGCGLDWSLLAAIGRIESDHGRLAPSRLTDDGLVTPALRGQRLDGSGGTSTVRDTDAGDLDGDRRFDRAVGPMQLLPSTWGVVGVDADGDGRRDPDDLDDAALGTAVLLCGTPGRLSDEAGMREALRRYNAAPGYAAAVVALEREYHRAGVPAATLGSAAAALFHTTQSAPSATLDALLAPYDVTPDDGSGGTGGHPGHDGGVTAPAGGPKHGDKHGGKHGGGHGGAHGGGHGGGHDGAGKGDGASHGGGGTTDDPGDQPTDDPTEDPTDQPMDPPTDDPTDPPTGDPTDDPDPALTCPVVPADGVVPPTTEPVVPDAPSSELVAVSGTLSCVDGAWSIGATPVLVGDDAWLATSALADADGDTLVETNLEELTGLLGLEVTATVDDTGTVWTLQDLPWLPVAESTPSASGSPTDDPTTDATGEPTGSPTGNPDASATP